jgi:hypothetical protein
MGIVYCNNNKGLPVVKWLAHYFSPLRSQDQISVRTFSMRLEPSPLAKRAKVNALPKVLGPLRVLQFSPTGKADGVAGLGKRVHSSWHKAVFQSSHEAPRSSLRVVASN